MDDNFIPYSIVIISWIIAGIVIFYQIHKAIQIIERRIKQDARIKKESK